VKRNLWNAIIWSEILVLYAWPNL